MKGQAGNYLVGILVLFFFAITAMIAMLIYSGFLNSFATTGLDTGLANEVGQSFFRTFQMFDYITVFILVGLIIGVALTSWRLNTNMAFFIVSIMMASFTGFISYVFNFIFVQFISNPSIVGILVYFPRTILLCTNFHWISLAFFVVGSIALYGKREKGTGGTFIDE